MRSEAQNEQIHTIAVALLKRKGIEAERATYEEAADAYVIAEMAVSKGKTTVADAIAVAAIGDDAPDKTTARLLGKFAMNGKYVADLSLTEEEFLAAAIAAEQVPDASHGVPSNDPLRIRAESAGYCRVCGQDTDGGDLCKWCI